MFTQVIKSTKELFQELFYFVFYNLPLLLLVGFFTYHTFLIGHLNWALVLALFSVSLMIICRVATYYYSGINHNLLYKLAVGLSGLLLIVALGVQTVRFFYVFLPGLAAPTLPIILVRIGIATAILYVYALFVTGGFYLYYSGMIDLFWNAAPYRLPELPLLDKKRQHLRQINISARFFIRTVFFGGAASIITLLIGFVAWLLNRTSFQ